MCSYVVNRVEKCMNFISCSWIPQSPTTLAIASFAAMYGRRLGETYAPGYIADFFIQKTIVYMGSETLGRATGVAVVAPMFTPELTPLAVMAVSGIMFYVAVLIGNLIHKIFTHLKKPNTIKTEKKTDIEVIV